MSDTPEFRQAFCHVFGGEPGDLDLEWRIELVRDPATRLQQAQMRLVEKARERIEAAKAVMALVRHREDRPSISEDDPLLKEARRRLAEAQHAEAQAHQIVADIWEAQDKVRQEGVVAAAHKAKAERLEREAKKALRAAE
jgi:hypothetical protein